MTIRSGRIRQEEGKAISRKALFGGSATPRVVIIGAGFSGIGLAVLLKQAGIDTFTIYERADRVGGTWWHNQYPGAEVDSVSYVYSYVFRPNPWTRTHAKQAELQAYLEGAIDDFAVRPHLRLGVRVVSADWDDDAHVYRVALSTGETTECHVLVGATGFLNIPSYPTWPGLDSFHGPRFHTSRWEGHHDLRGKTVAVVGTGSTATQLVPELARVVGKLYLFQREPGWVVPKGDFDYTSEQSAQFANPVKLRIASGSQRFYATEKRL